jgi:hypothetical protein
VLAVGSTSPGLLQFAIDKFSLVFPDYKERVIKHGARVRAGRAGGNVRCVDACGGVRCMCVCAGSRIGICSSGCCTCASACRNACLHIRECGSSAQQSLVLCARCGYGRVELITVLITTGRFCLCLGYTNLKIAACSIRRHACAHRGCSLPDWISSGLPRHILLHPAGTGACGVCRAAPTEASH